MHHPYRAVVVGCGSIGALKPAQYDNPDGANILTHAHAFHAHPQTELVAVVDTDRDKAYEAASKWGVPAYETLSIAMCEQKPDIISICVPTEHHYNMLLKALAYNPRLVIAEKPFCTTAKSAKDIVKKYNEVGIPLAVDYIRRYAPEIQRIKEEIQVGAFGKIYHARALYGRGLQHEGCHALDLFRFWFGEVTACRIPWGTTIDDYKPEDLTMGVQLSYERCPDVALVATDSRAYSVFDIDVVTERAHIHLTDHGRMYSVRMPIPEPVYGDYPTLPGKPNYVLGTGLPKGFFYLVENCVEHLENGEPLACTGLDAYKVREILENISYSRRGHAETRD